MISEIVRTDGDILQDIKAIATSQSRAEKESALRTLVSYEHGSRIVKFCYDPFVTFGIKRKKIPTFRDSSLTTDNFQIGIVFNLLQNLAMRSLSGNDARFAVDNAFVTLNPSAAEILWLCLNKDLKVGIAESTIRAVDYNLIPTFAVMRADTYSDKKVKSFPVAIEPKLDGNRVTFVSRNGSGAFVTRTGKPIEALDHMIKPTLDLLKEWFGLSRIGEDNNVINHFISTLNSTNGIPDIMLDGEMMGVEGDDFNALNGSLNRKGLNADTIYYIFDMLSYDEFDTGAPVPVSYYARRVRVDSIIDAAYGNVSCVGKFKKTPFVICLSYSDIQAEYETFLGLGFEGAIVKDPSSFYYKKKSASWLKIKQSDTEDLLVVGAMPGEPGSKYENTLGRFIVRRVHDGGVTLVRVAGIPDSIRDAEWAKWQRDYARINSELFSPYKGSGVIAGFDLVEDTTYEYLGQIIEVKFQEVTPDGSLRHPSYVRHRPDKRGEVSNG